MPHALVLAGNALIAGGKGKVAAYDTSDGRQLWQGQIDGDAYGLAVASGHLLASTDAGAIYCFTGQADRVAQRTADSANVPPKQDRSAAETATAGKLEETDGLDTDGPTPPAGPEARDLPITAEGPGRASGPFVVFTAAGTIRVTWVTDTPTSTRLEMARLEQGKPGTPVRRVSRDGAGEDGAGVNGVRGDNRPKREHEVTIPTIEQDALYTYRVGGLDDQGQPAWTSWYRFDAMLHYLSFSQAPAPPNRVLQAKAASPYPDNPRTRRMRTAAEKIIATAGPQRGYVLVLGAEDGCLAYQLASLSDLKILVVESAAENVQRIRTLLDQAGLYGHRVAVLQGNLETIRFAPYFANVITSERMLDDGVYPSSFANVYHCLRPSGGLLWLSGPAAKNNFNPATVRKWCGDTHPAGDDSEWLAGKGALSGQWPAWTYHRGRLPGAGEWSHQYALPDNASCSRDDTIRGDMSVLWWGRPGARPMPDRGNRNPSPVSAGGRLYVQGDRTLFGMDAYNGTILWFQQIPTMRRTNIPRDGSNMVATDDILYLALEDRCIGLEGATGRRLFDFSVPHEGAGAARPNGPKQGSYNWGYLAAIEDRILGSTVHRGAQYLGDDGEWFEDFEIAATARVTSTNLFARNRHSGKRLWNYVGGAIMNSTITASDELVWFVESRSEAARKAQSSRLFTEVLQDQYLVAVELGTGKVRWEHPIDLSQCQYMTYLCYSEGKLVMTGTDQDQTFHTYVYYATDGEPLWEHHAKAKKEHHSGKLDHPTIVGNRLYLNKHVYDLSSGNVLEVDEFDWHGCGVMSASSHTLFRRFEFHGMVDLHTKKRTEFLGLRSGCWLSLIPSGGLLLAPESSAGCSCDHAIQTSLAYVPRAALAEKP